MKSIYKVAMKIKAKLPDADMSEVIKTSVGLHNMKSDLKNQINKIDSVDQRGTSQTNQFGKKTGQYRDA